MSEENPPRGIRVRLSNEQIAVLEEHSTWWEAALARTPEQIRADQAITAEREKVERASRRCECDCHDDWWEDER
jgi:hypothetical protein